MKKIIEIKTFSPYGSCIDNKKIHLDNKLNNLLYSCPECKHKHDYVKLYFGLEPNGKSMFINSNVHDQIKTECVNCFYEGNIFEIIEIKESSITIKESDFLIKSISF